LNIATHAVFSIVAFSNEQAYIGINNFNEEDDNMLRPYESSRKTEAQVLESFGLRWAVLSAWYDELRSCDAVFDGDIAGMLEASRVKIASGCTSSCEVGCDLARVEASLVSRAATVEPDKVDRWIETLSEAMTEPEAVRGRPWFRPVNVSYLDCGYRPCVCAS
jgi:hypothetical protein